MSYTSSAELREPFCSYCGHPPVTPRQHHNRVCERCRLGMVLRAPTGCAPRADEPFLIIDDGLTVQAISERAERLLRIEEPDSVRMPLTEFLEAGDIAPGQIELGVALAVRGGQPETVELRRVDQPEQRFHARITSCGSPAAALVVLAPVRADRRSRRQPITGSSLRHEADDLTAAPS
jgi:hypothetical protein